MRKVLASLSVITMFSLSATAGMAQAQTSCPPEVASAKAMLTQTAKSQDVQAPRSLAGAKQDVQAPRSQEIQAPRSQDVQAPAVAGGCESRTCRRRVARRSRRPGARTFRPRGR